MEKHLSDAVTHLTDAVTQVTEKHLTDDVTHLADIVTQSLTLSHISVTLIIAGELGYASSSMPNAWNAEVLSTAEIWSNLKNKHNTAYAMYTAQMYTL